MDEIRVHVVKYCDRRNYMLRYLDPLTGRHVAKSSGTANERKALEAAGKWQAELREGRYQKPGRFTWEAFRDFYASNALPGLAIRTQQTYESTLNVFEEKCKPARLADVTTSRVTAFVGKLREGRAAESTVAHHLRHLKAAMPLFMASPRVRSRYGSKSPIGCSHRFEKVPAGRGAAASFLQTPFRCKSGNEGKRSTNRSG